MAQDTPVQPRKRQKRDFQIATMEDLPNEIILKILELVNIKDLFQCMAVNKRLRKIAHDQSLWNIMHLTGEAIADVLPAELLQQIFAKGDLISESLSICLQSPKMGAKQITTLSTTIHRRHVSKILADQKAPPAAAARRISRRITVCPPQIFRL